MIPRPQLLGRWSAYGTDVMGPEGFLLDFANAVAVALKLNRERAQLTLDRYEWDKANGEINRVQRIQNVRVASLWIQPIGSVGLKFGLRFRDPNF
jgi:hypothetical protein